MGARQKLNNLFFNGSLIVAGVIGAASGSWIVFGVCLTLLIGSQIANGDIRVNRRKK